MSWIEWLYPVQRQAADTALIVIVSEPRGDNTLADTSARRARLQIDAARPRSEPVGSQRRGSAYIRESSMRSGMARATRAGPRPERRTTMLTRTWTRRMRWSSRATRWTRYVPTCGRAEIRRTERGHAGRDGRGRPHRREIRRGPCGVRLREGVRAEARLGRARSGRAVRGVVWAERDERARGAGRRRDARRRCGVMLTATAQAMRSGGARAGCWKVWRLRAVVLMRESAFICMRFSPRPHVPAVGLLAALSTAL
jgi:hypothetical protein